MIFRKLVITIIFLCDCIFLLSQDYSYKNKSFRFGVGYESMINEDQDVEDMTSVVFYAGFQFRKMDGRLRIVPSIDFSIASFEFDQLTSIDLIGSNLSLSGNYDIFKWNKSSLFAGIGGGLRMQSMLLKTCEPDQECTYTTLGSGRGASININLGYRYEKEESKWGYEFYGRVFYGDFAQLVQVIMLVDLKLK